MIRADFPPHITPAPDSPRAELADLLNGTALGRDSTAVGTTLVTVSPLGVVRVDGVKVLIDGRPALWSDGVQALAAAVRGMTHG